MKSLVYVRYSPRPQELCESLEFQEDFVRRYFDYVGIEVGKVIGDPEISARLTPLRKRKGGQELLELTTGKNPKFHTVGAYRLDRLWRNVVDGNLTLRAWRKSGIACHFAAEGGQSINTTTATGRFIVNILLSKAEYEPDLTSERTSAAMLRKQANGISMSKHPLYGKQFGAPVEVFVKGKLCRRNTLVDNPAELEVIEKIRGMNADGMGVTKIARTLNKEGVPCRGGVVWRHALIGRILARTGDVAANDAKVIAQDRV